MNCIAQNYQKKIEKKVSHECIKCMQIVVYFIVYYHKIYTNLSYVKMYQNLGAHTTIYGAICSEEECTQIGRCRIKSQLHKLYYILCHCNNFTHTCCYCGKSKCCKYLTRRMTHHEQSVSSKLLMAVKRDLAVFTYFSSCLVQYHKP